MTFARIVSYHQFLPTPCMLLPPRPRSPQDQRPVETVDHMAIFTSDPLSGLLFLHGKITASLWVATDKFDGDVTVKVSENERANNIRLFRVP